MPIKTDKPNIESFIRKTDTEMPEHVHHDPGQKEKRFLLRSPYGLWYELQADTPREGLPIIKVSFLWDKLEVNMGNLNEWFRMVERFSDIQSRMLAATMDQVRGVQSYWNGLFKYMSELMKPFLAFPTGAGKSERQNPVAPTIAKQSPVPATPSPVPSMMARVPVKAPPTPAALPRKPAPAGRTKPIKAKSSITASGKSPSSSLTQLSGTRRPGKKPRQR